MPPQKICDFGTYELRAQLTSAHTQTLRVRVAATRKERALLLEPNLPCRKCTLCDGRTLLRPSLGSLASKGH